MTERRMNADLDRIIRLQQLDTFIESARRRVTDHPILIESLDSRLASAIGDLDGAKSALAENQASRRSVEKDLAAIQSRLSKYKGQLMEVKTNKEYQAMLKEIEAAQHEVAHLEDKVLEHMIAADELNARVARPRRHTLPGRSTSCSMNNKLPRCASANSSLMRPMSFARRSLSSWESPTYGVRGPSKRTA